MSKERVLFVHGGGQGAYEEDEKVVAGLQEVLGDAYEVRAPKMPKKARSTRRGEIESQRSSASGSVAGSVDGEAGLRGGE